MKSIAPIFVFLERRSQVAAPAFAKVRRKLKSRSGIEISFLPSRGRRRATTDDLPAHIVQEEKEVGATVLTTMNELCATTYSLKSLRCDSALSDFHSFFSRVLETESVSSNQP